MLAAAGRAATEIVDAAVATVEEATFKVTHGIPAIRGGDTGGFDAAIPRGL